MCGGGGGGFQALDSSAHVNQIAGPITFFYFDFLIKMCDIAPEGGNVASSVTFILTLPLWNPVHGAAETTFTQLAAHTTQVKKSSQRFCIKMQSFLKVALRLLWQ